MPSKVERWLAAKAKEQEGTATDKIRADRAIDSGSEEFRVGAELDRYVGKASALAPYSPAPTTTEQPKYVEQTPLERKEQKLVSAARQRAEKRKTAGDDFYKKEYGMTKAEYDKEYDAIDRMSAMREARSDMQEIEDTAKARAEEKVALAPLVKEYKDAFIGILPESAYAGYSPVGDKEEIKEDIVLNYLMTLPAEERYAQLEKAAYRSTIVPRIEALKEKATQFMNEEAERIIEMQKHVPVPGYAGAAGMQLGASGTWESPVEYLEDLYTSVKKDDFKSGFVEAADWRDFISFGLASLGGDAAKLQALHKAYKGEPLTEQDKFFIEVAEIEQALEDFRTEKGGASSWNSLGSGAAHSSQFMTEMLMTGGLGGAAKVATGGIKQAFKQGVGRGFAHLTFKNLPKTIGYGAKRSPLMAGTYRNLMDRRINQYSVANGQVDLTNPESLWKSIGVAWVDQTFEISSELWGNMLHLGFGKIGKAIGADKWLKTKSVNLKPTPAMRRVFRDGLLWSGDIPSEMTSEFLGDVATNLAYSAFNKDEQYWGELFTWNYWGNLLALTAGLKAGVTVASLPSIVASNKKVKQLEARSAESFNAIGNEELKGKVLNLGGRTDIEDVAEYMHSIDWSQYKPIEVAHAIDYMMSEVERQVVAGSETEQERAYRYAPRLERIQELAYRNAEGVAMPTMITAEANFGVDNTQGVTILEGDYNNPEAMVRVRLADGTTDVVLGEKLSNVVETDMASLVAEDYAMTFAEEEAMETLGEVEQTLFDMQRTGASNTQQIRAVEKAGLTVFNEGEVVTLLNGEEATVVEGFRHGLYTVMRADGSLSIVGVGGILQPDVAMAQAQRSVAMPQEQTPLTQSAPLPEDIDTTTDYATPDGFVGKAVDYNAESDQVTLQSADGGLTNVPRASLTVANAEQVAPQEDITENLATETISEMEQSEAEEAPMPVAPQTAPIPQNEDGSVDYESMTDATMYANALESDMGNVADAQEAVADVRQSKEAELAKLQEQKKQTANMNEKVALRQQEQRLVQQIAMLNEVESILANRNNAIEAETAQVNEAVETTLNNSSYNLSDEIDENGRQFVLNSNGDTAFGWVDAESGLTPAPIMLSEGIITNPATNDGYGLVHIEARHGKQIRENGYASVLDFIEEVAKNYEVIREGKNRNGEQTYLLQLTDKHNNTLMVELSGDGTYWNINTAGVFKTSYGRNNKVVYNRQTTAKQPAEAIETSQSVEQNGTQSPSSLIDAPTPNVPSENKDTNSVPNVQELEQKNNAITIAENAGIKENDFAKQLRNENPAEYNTFNALAKLLGLEIEFVESAGEGNALIVGNKMQAAYNPANREETLRFLIGHESLHRLKQVAPEAYAELMEDVKAHLGEELFGQRVERLQQRYDKQGIAITEEALEEEVVADFIGEMEEDYNVVSDLATQNPNKSWWQKLIEGLRNLFSFLEEAEADTTKVASILNKIETAYKAAAEKVQTLEVETVNGEVSAEEADVRYSIKDEDTSAIMNSAKEEFEATDDWGVTGWLLPDGTQLSFAEEESFERDIDHRAIGIAYIGTPDKRWQYLQDFERRGGIRISANYGEGTIEMMVAPTPEQMRKISSFSRYESGNISIDFMDDNYNTVHSVYYENANPSRISADIDRYFDEGIKPIGNVQYSLKDTFYSNAEFAVRNIKQEKATPEQWLKMIEKNGGLKAGEDKWLGLSDWLKEQMRGSIKEKPTTININGTEYNVKELEEQILSDIKAMLGETGFEDELIGIRLVGSYARGEQRPDSDIDVIVEYKGNSTEDTLFNVLNDEEHRINIGGVDVDINPITEGKSGTLDEWEKRNAGFTKKPITLTKDEVLDYIHQNQIQIEEVEYTADAVGFDALKAEYDALLRNEGYDAAHDTMIDRFGDDFDIAFSDLGGELIIENEEAAATLLGSGNIINSTRLEYTTNGLDNHREIALTVPTIEPWNTSDAVHFGDAGDGRAVAWIRFGETTDTEGKRVLVIDEIQSKRHQEGRERGYRSIQLEKEMLLAKEKLAKTNRELGDYKSGLKEKYDFKNIKGSFFERHQIFYGALLAEERAQLDTLAEKRNDAEAKWQSLQLKATGIPSAPFEKNWAELAMKRILRYAAENGYDKVAWTTGDQQSERYDLSHMVDYIDAERNVDGTYNINVATTDDSHYVQETNIAENKLSELVGKDIAFGIISSIENSDSNKAHIEADDMTIGGSGMKAFYDQMLPSFMRKYAKKWGATVGEVTMPNLEENNTMHSVDVTPAMRESVMQGQPMFSLRNPEWQSQFGVPLADGKELSLEDVRTIFEKTNKGKFYQKIFDRVYAVMEKLPRKVIKVVEELPDKRKVLGTASTKGDVTFRTVLFKNYGEQAIAETILHELIHSVTTYATHAYAKQATSEKHSKAYDALPAEIKKACRELQSVYNRLSKKNDLKGAYGIKNIHEMLAELSNPQFRTLVKEGGFWKVLLNALKRMFGFEGTYNAELAELDNILSSFLENYNEEAYMDAVESIYGEDIFTTIEEVDAKEMRKPFGGNSGYVGYSMSKRAAYAREEGRYPKTDFKKVYNMPQATLDALVKEGVIYDKEWHHTSVYGNKTIFYGWGDDGEYPELAELYKERKKSIDKAVKDGADLSSFVEMFSKREEEIFEQRHLEYLAEVERVKQNVLARQQREEYIRKHIPSVIKASNGAEVYTNNSPYLSDWVATKDGERLSKRNRKEERDVAFNEVSKIVSAIGQEYDVASATSSLKDENKPLEGQYNALKETDNQGKEVKYSIADSVEVFDATRNLAVANIGIVMPNLSSKIVQIVKYSGEERPPIEKSNDDVLKWAKKNITTQDSYIVDSNGVRHDCPITANSVTEMLNNRAIKSSVNRNVHLLALPLLKAILANSIEVEIHPDYNKVDGERKPENGYNPDVLMHRFYGAVEIEGVIYRTKSTVKEYRDKNTELKPYTYEVTKIELLPNSTADTNNAHGRPLSIESNSIDATKLLQNISKSYDKEVKILDESVKNSLKSLDAPYLDAVARGDMATAERMVREAAAIAMPNTKVVDEDGLPKIVEHSTWNDDFYTFDINHLGESSGDEGVYGAGFYFGNVGETELYGDRAIQAYLNLHNPLVLPDAPIKGFFDYLVENFDKEGLRDIVVKQGNHTATMGDVVDAIKSVNEAHAQGKYAELIEQMSQYWMGAEGRVLEQQIFRKIGFAIYPTLEPFIQYNVGRKEFSEALRNAGYDGVVYNNQEYIAFEPNQIKSADVVTYDDAGNIIPLSERFNPEKEDIRYSLREATSEKLTPAMIRHHMMENVTRHHEQEVNRINRFYDREERQAKALAKKARKEAGLVYPKNGKITDRLAFLIPDGKTTLPMELQVTYDIANGLKLKWSDSKDGRKHGLSSELGLGSSRKEGYGAITVGATMYVEDYVAQLMEENSGYSRDLDDNDIRNAVINVLSQYTKPKHAIQALEDIFLSNEMDDAEAEALYKIDLRRQEALEEENARYEGLKASYERNPRAFERDYFEQMEKDVVALNFKEREIRRLKRDIKALRNTHNKTYREQAERIQKVREAIDDFLKSTYGRNISTTEVKRLFDALQKATTQKQLERVIEAVSRMEKRTTDRIEQERKRRLLKMKLSFFIPADAISLEEYLKDENQKASDAAAIIDYYNTENSDPVMNTFRIALKDRYKGKDSSGVSVAKLIDAETAEIMSFISTNATRRDIVEANLAEEAAKLYEAKEKLKGKLPFSQSTMDKIDQAYEVVLDYWEAYIKRQGAISYHTAMLELSIKIEMTKKKRDKAQQDGNEKEYEEAFMYLAELMKETRELAEAYYGGLGNANKQLMEANDAVERLLLGGRRLLSEEREAKRKHDAEVLRDAINDITNYGEEYKELNAKAHDQRKASKDKKPSLLKRIHSEWADSLEYLLNVMAPYAPEGSGLTYQRIIGGALGAASTLYINTKVVNMAVEGAIKRIWGGKMKHNTLPKLLNQSQQIVLAENYVIGYYEETEDGKKVKKPRRWCLTMGNAIYLLAMWEQPDSHYKLTANGVTQEVIDDVTSLIVNKDARWIEFKNWVVDELLPARREVYDETHRKVQGTYMAESKNYFPIHILSQDRHQEEKASEEKAQQRSIKPSGIKQRVYNTNMIDLNVDFVKALMDNLYTMEMWAAIAPVEEDMNVILSNNTAKNLMNAKFGADFSQRLKTAMQVTVGTLTSGYINSTEKFFQDLTRRWGGTKIAFGINTALKQLAGAGAMCVYTTDWRFLWYLAKNIQFLFTPKSAQEFFPMLQKRWEEGLAGNIGLKELFRSDVTTSSGFAIAEENVNRVTTDIVKLGMIPNKIVDMAVCAMMAKSVYEYEYNRYIKQGYSKEMAEKKAMIDAESSYNKTQQSSEMAFLSSGQVSSNILYRSLNIFMNNSIANYRIGVMGIEDIKRGLFRFRKAQRNMRKATERRLFEQYTASGMAEEEARAKAQQEADIIASKLSRSSFWAKGFFRSLWGFYFANIVFGFMGIAPYLLFGDDDDKKEELIIDLLKSSVFTPLTLIPTTKAIYETFAYAWKRSEEGRGYQVSIAESLFPMLEDVDQLITNGVGVVADIADGGDMSYAQIYNTIDALLRMGVGVDTNRMFAITDGFIDLGNGDWLEGSLDVLSVPKSQIKLLIGDRKDGETAKEYMARVMRTMSIVDKNKIDVAELENYNFELGKWEKPTNISAAEKRKVSEIYRQYQAEYKKDMLKRCSEEVRTDYPEVVEKHAEILKDMGVQDTKLALVKYYEQMVDTLTPEAASALNRLAVLQAEISATERSLDLLVSQDGKEYIDLLTEEFNLRKEFVAQYEIYKNLTE